MIRSAKNQKISELYQIEGDWIYEIPKYQREYTWGQNQWELLYDDLMENESGYYLGSIICINRAKDDKDTRQFELVDGQQRMMTISLLLASIYHALDTFDLKLEDDQKTIKMNDVKRKLVISQNDRHENVRLIPQVHGNNQDDFYGVLSEVRVIHKRDLPKNVRNRRIYKAFKYFIDRIEVTISEAKESPKLVMENLLSKINSACMVEIVVNSHSDAYTLFESLNNRGIPLNAIDLIKNKMLATLDDQDGEKTDVYFEKWQRLLEYISEDYSTQERFFRHYYNAFRTDLEDIYSVPLARKSNLIQIYERLIDYDAKVQIDKIFEAGRLYSYILSRAPDNEFDELEKSIRDLDHIQGAPSHLLLLYLLSNKSTLSLTSLDLKSVIDVLVSFFVRRNLTDTPPTRDLDQLFMRIISNVEVLKGKEILWFIQNELVEISASDQVFHDHLNGSIYKERGNVARFLLCALAEQGMSRENEVDLWSREKNHYVWTIEHVMPQGTPMPPSWINLMTRGDEKKATEIQELYVHKLGNLTISAYNSSLGTKSFEMKRDRVNSKGIYIGYKNGLILNRELAAATSWSVEQIVERTESIVKEVMDKYALDRTFT